MDIGKITRIVEYPIPERRGKRIAVPNWPKPERRGDSEPAPDWITKPAEKPAENVGV